MRGEDYKKKFNQQANMETPPRAWGRPIGIPPAVEDMRNTPTCVGKTKSNKSAGQKAKKHPHVRGEDPMTNLISGKEAETPPRAWGRPIACA